MVYERHKIQTNHHKKTHNFLMWKRIITRKGPLRGAVRPFSGLSLKDMDWKHASSPMESAFTPPSSWYSEKKFFDSVDRKQIFPNSWLLVGHVKDLQNDGDYIAGNVVGDHPYLVVNSNGTLKGHYNVCRHHAAQLLDEGTGSVKSSGSDLKQIRCPYHGWQYTLDGRLAKATHIKGCANFKPKENSLIPILVDQLGPWVFLRLDPQGSSGTLRGDVPDAVILEQLLQETQYSELVHVERRMYDLRCNWKVFLDNYLDGGYHVPVAHPGLSESLNMTTYKRQGHSDLFVQSCASKKSATSADQGAAERVTAGARDALYLFLYPNLCINRYGNWMDTNIVWPTGVNTCTVAFDWYVTADLAKDAAYVQSCIADSEQVQREDIWLCERVQAGLQSPAYGTGGRYAPLMEQGEYLYHQRIYKDYLAAVQKEI